MIAAPSVNQVFSVDFEVNAQHVEADMALRLNVQPVEIVYDEVRTPAMNVSGQDQTEIEMRWY